MRLGIGMTFLLGMMLASPLLGHAEEEDWMPEEKKHLAGAKPSQSPKRPAEPKKAIGTAAEPKKATRNRSGAKEGTRNRPAPAASDKTAKWIAC
jgi:hypothetical protein